MSAAPVLTDIMTDITPADLGERIARHAAELTGREHQLITDIGRFEASGEWARQGAKTCAQWLSWKIGLTAPMARERIRVAKAIAVYREVDAAFAKAELSYAKVRAITRVVTPENESLLVEIARCTPASQLERICRRFRASMDLGHPDDVEVTRRRVMVRYPDEGTVRVTIELPAEEGARLLAAIDAARGVKLDEERAKAIIRDDLPSRADGVMTMVESYLADGTKTRLGGAPTEVLLHVSAETLTGADGPDAYVENAGEQGVAAATAQRMCCDAGITTVVEGEQGEVLDVGRKRRSFPPAIMAALVARHGRRCMFPGCEHTDFLEGHHAKPWYLGGETKVDNASLLCRLHHRFVHEWGWTMERGEDGQWTFIAPTGQRIAPAPALPYLDRDALDYLADHRDGEAVEIDDLALTADWDGDPLDHHRIVEVLARATPRWPPPESSEVQLSARETVTSNRGDIFLS